MDNSIKLPSNFSDIVMTSIYKEVEARKKREDRLMYLAIIGVGLLLMGAIVYLAYRYGWLSSIKLDLSAIQNSFAYVSPTWIIVTVNASLLLCLYFYLSRKLQYHD
ncbi:MAG: hypothetical protein RR388_08610 [Rikenellaceae bacterium]